MKKVFLILALFIVASCSSENDNSKSEKTKKIKKTEIASGNFEVLQSKNKEKAKETLIVVIDPHGDGKFALSKFEKIADNYDCTLIGLNDVENNQPDYMQNIENDIYSAKRKLNLRSKQIYIAGFSGGARMAFQYALSHKTNGILMCGAGINMQKISMLDFPLAMIVGTKDFNFIEQYYSPFSEVVKNKNVLTLVFDGIHEWPPENDILTAIRFLFGKTGIQSALNQNFIKEGDKFLKEKDYFKAFKKYELAYKTGIPESENKLNKLLNDKNFKVFVKQYEASLQKEIDRNNLYIQYLNSKKLSYWHSEILTVTKLMKSKNRLEAESYARTKAYLGIAMYSFVNKEITNPWSKNIDKYLKIYEYLEPENPDMWFFASVREKQKNNSALSEKYLKRAFVFGFKDTLKAEKYGLIVK